MILRMRLKAKFIAINLIAGEFAARVPIHIINYLVRAASPHQQTGK